MGISTIISDFLKDIDFKTLFLTLGAIFGGYILKPYVSHFFLLRQNKFQNIHAEKLQIDNFVRNLSGKEMYSIFYEWQKILLDSENSIISSNKNQNQHTKDYVALVQKTFSYGSTNTIEILAAYSQFNYSHTEEVISDENDPSKNIKSSYVSLYFFAKIISSLKKDFSGQDISPENLLKIKIKDYKQNQSEILKAKKYIHNNFNV